MMVGVPGKQQETSNKDYLAAVVSIPILTILELDPFSFIVLVLFVVKSQLN